MLIAKIIAQVTLRVTCARVWLVMTALLLMRLQIVIAIDCIHVQASRSIHILGISHVVAWGHLSFTCIFQMTATILPFFPELLCSLHLLSLFGSPVIHSLGCSGISRV